MKIMMAPPPAVKQIAGGFSMRTHSVDTQIIRTTVRVL